MNSTRHRLQGAAWLTVAPIILNFISVGANAYLIPTLGPTEYGLWTTAMALVGFSRIITNLGLRQVYTRAIAGTDLPTQQTLLREQLGLRLLLATGAAALVPLSAILLQHEPRVVLTAAIFSIAMPISIAWTVLADVLTAREMFRKSAMAGFWAGLVLTLASVLAAAAGWGAPGVAVSYLIGPLINFLILWREVHRLGLRIEVGGSLRRFKEMLEQSRQIATADLVTSIRARAEGVYVPKLLGTTSYGLLSAGAMPASRLEGFSDGIATAHFPQIAAADARGDDATARALVREMFVLVLMITLPLLTMLMILAPSVVMIFYGDPALTMERSMAHTVMMISALTIPSTGLVMAYRNALQAAAMHDQTARAVRDSMILSGFAGLGLILWLGIPGAALSFFLRRSLALVFMTPHLRRRYPGVLGSLPAVRLVGPSAAMALLALVTGWYQALNLGWTIAAASALGVVGMAGILMSGVIAMRDLPFLGPYLAARMKPTGD